MAMLVFWIGLYCECTFFQSDNDNIIDIMINYGVKSTLIFLFHLLVTYKQLVGDIVDFSDSHL